MYLKLRKGKLRELISQAMQKAGNIYELTKKIGIPKSTLSGYHMENRLIKRDNLNKIAKYLGKTINKTDILKELPNNWRQIIGGKKCVKIKKQRGTFKRDLIKARKNQSKRLKEWHQNMKANNPMEYYKIQYSRFKKIGGYKIKTKKGEQVRNRLEKEVADVLKDMGIEYKYEPLIKADNRYFFPDFLVKNRIIIECTSWKGTDKAIKLKEKIKHLKNRYKVYVVIPKSLNKYYKILNNHLVLGVDDFVPVAQTFRTLKA